jgi:hypothetical protein
MHGDEFELEQVLDVACPDLHGATQNHDFVVFDCGDGVLVAHEHDGSFDAIKIENIEALEGVRIVSLYGY